MKILVIGSGGREHALAWKCSTDKFVEKVYVAPGNAGTLLEEKIENISLDINNNEDVSKFCVSNNIELVIVGPEDPLVNGLVDFLESKNIKVFGPRKGAAQLEGSKTFAKDFFIKYGIPTANYKSFDNHHDALKYLDNIDFPSVVKADGLAAGKGVIICNDREAAEKALEDIFESNAFGDAGNRVVIEDFLNGEEASFIAVVSDDQIIPLATSQDHKAVGDGDVGLNTGGMGAYSPAPIVTDEIHKRVIDEIMLPTMSGLKAEGFPYLGFLYAGLMIEGDEIKVLEFNCRFGDPETQPIMLRLESSLTNLCLDAINKRLDEHQIEWSSMHSCGVVLASAGYPEDYETDLEIDIKNHFSGNEKLFHAGTKFEDNKILTSGGRVFCMTALGETLEIAIDNAYNAIPKINFEGMFFRSDIGKKGLNND